MWRLIPLTFLPASNPTGSIEGPLFAPLWRSGCRECQLTGWPRGLPARAPRHRVHREYAPACRPTPTARNSCAPCSSAGNPSAGAATGSRSPARKAARRPRRGYRPRADDRRVWPAGSTVPGSPIPRPSDRLGIATPIGHSVLGSPSSTCGAPPQSTAPHIESQPARPTQLLSGRALIHGLYAYVFKVDAAAKLNAYANTLHFSRPQLLPQTRSKFLITMEWRHLAARDAAFSLFHFQRTFEALREQALRRSSTLRRGIDFGKLRIAWKLYASQFKDVVKMRHAIGHAGEFYNTVEERAKHSGRSDFFVEFLMTDTTLSVSAYGKLVSVDVSQQTIDRLERIRTLVVEAFSS